MSQEVQQPINNDLQRSFKVQNFTNPGIIMRERSFIRPQSHHAYHNQIRDNGKRRSMILTNNGRGKPSLEIYRPPGVRTDGVQSTTPVTSSNKLNVHAKEFTMKPITHDLHNVRSGMQVPYGMSLQHSRSSGALLHSGGGIMQNQYRPLQPIIGGQLMNSASTTNFMNNSSVSVSIPAQTQRVHFKLQPMEKKKSPPSSLINGSGKGFRSQPFPAALKRSKSLTSADALATGMAALGLAADTGDLGTFPPEVQDCIDKALEDPNLVPPRTLMDAVGYIVSRAAESTKYGLPAARRCIAVVEKETSGTFLESLLNTCQLWYQEREKRLCTIVNGGRPRLMAFLSFLLEMFCQLRRRTLSRRTNNGNQGNGAPSTPLEDAARTLLTLIARTCEDTVREPIPSPSDTENLFFVLTYIGRDLETQLPNELEKLLSAIRDAFLNSSAVPSIRKTLLQLIELHASRWQLPGCAVLYYYPSSK